jgi:hypothetical protein
VEASSRDDAKSWGDHHAKAHSSETGEPFLSSSVEVATDEVSGIELLPVIRFGVPASDDEIGW